MKNKNNFFDFQMIKLSCPHCFKIGLVPEFFTNVSGWPIACHHCNQNYFAPVVSHFKKIERLIELECPNCIKKSRLETNYFQFIKRKKFLIYCPSCHKKIKHKKVKIKNKNIDMVELNTKNSIISDKAFLSKTKNYEFFFDKFIFFFFCLSVTITFLFQSEALEIIEIFSNINNINFSNQYGEMFNYITKSINNYFIK